MLGKKVLLGNPDDPRGCLCRVSGHRAQFQPGIQLGPSALLDLLRRLTGQAVLREVEENRIRRAFRVAGTLRDAHVLVDLAHLHLHEWAGLPALVDALEHQAREGLEPLLASLAKLPQKELRHGVDAAEPGRVQSAAGRLRACRGRSWKPRGRGVRTRCTASASP